MTDELKDLYAKLEVLEAEKTQSKHIESLIKHIKQIEEKLKNAH